MRVFTVLNAFALTAWLAWAINTDTHISPLTLCVASVWAVAIGAAALCSTP